MPPCAPPQLSNLIDRNICRELSTRKLKFKPEACKQDLVYSTEERNMICDELEGSDCVYNRAIIMQFCLGCRISEVKGLYWSDIDFDRKEVMIHRELVDDEDGSPIINNYTKNGLSEGNRTLPLSPRAERIKTESIQSILKLYFPLSQEHCVVDTLLYMSLTLLPTPILISCPRLFPMR